MFRDIQDENGGDEVYREEEEDVDLKLLEEYEEQNRIHPMWKYSINKNSDFNWRTGVFDWSPSLSRYCTCLRFDELYHDDCNPSVL